MNKLLFFLFFLFVASGFAQENNFPTNGTIGMTGAVVPNTLNFLTTESPSWVKVGTLNLGQHGNNTSIKFYGGDGYNESVKVKLQNTWPDYVFDCGHQLLPLSELETYVSKNKHLPDVPSADQVAKDGIDLADMNGTLLKKIEELTLYIIQLKNDIDRQQAEINRLKNTKR